MVAECTNSTESDAERRFESAERSSRYGWEQRLRKERCCRVLRGIV